MTTVIQSDVAIAKELDYKPLQSTYPSYVLHKVTQQSGGSEVKCTATGGLTSVFEMSANIVANQSKDILYFNMEIPACAVGKCNVLPVDTWPMIQQIQHYTKESVKMMDLDHVGDYLRVVLKKEMTPAEFKSRDVSNFFYRSDCLASANVRHDGTSASVSYDEPRYLEFSPMETGAGESKVTRLCQLKLSDLKFTIFDVDKDIGYPAITLLRIVWQSGTRCYWSCDAPGSPQLNPVAGTTFTISDLVLYSSQEADVGVANAVKAKIQSGINIIVPYVNTYKTNLSGTNQFITQRLNSIHGRKLKKILHSVFNNIETGNTSYDNSNVGAAGIGSKVTSLYSLLENKRMSEFDLRCSKATSEDYMFHKNQLANSIIQNQNMYQYNWFWCNEFGDETSSTESKNLADKNVISGLDLGMSEVRWDLNFNIPGGVQLNHYTFAICTKVLSITPSSIMVS